MALIDPAILVELTASTYQTLYRLGVKGVPLSNELISRAETLTAKYASTDWAEKDFWLTMEDESDRFLEEMAALYCKGTIEIS